MTQFTEPCPRPVGGRIGSAFGGASGAASGGEGAGGFAFAAGVCARAAPVPDEVRRVFTARTLPAEVWSRHARRELEEVRADLSERDGKERPALAGRRRRAQVCARRDFEQSRA